MYLTCLARGMLVSLGLIVLIGNTAYGSPFGSEAQDGVDLYNQEEYAQALKSFEAARLSNPEDGNVLYNLANTHYQLGNFDHAVEAFEAAESTLNDPSMKQKTLYNRGNAYYRMGDVEEAIKSYKKALELDPKDTDAKFNLEYARKQYERAKQANRISPKDKNQNQKNRDKGLNPSKQQESKEDGDQPEESSDANQSDQSENTQNTESANQENSNGGEQKETPDSQPSGKPTDDEQKMAKAMHEITSMNKDEADRWLNSLNEDLKKMSRRQVQGQMKDLFVEGGKDW